MIKQSFTVKAILRTDKERADGRCPINYLVRLNSVRTKLSSGEYAYKADWNSTLGIFKGGKSSLENSVLDRDVSRIKDFLREQRSINNVLTVELVKAFWTTNDGDDFYEMFDKFCEKKFKELEQGTIGHYKLLRKRLKEFKTNIRLSQINVGFIQSFDYFLREKLNTGNAGVWGRHKNLKVVLNHAYKTKRIQSNPYENFKCKQSEPEINPLNAVELKLIEKIVFSKFKKSKGLELSRDIFLFTAYTGLRYSDVMSLKPKNISNGFINKKQKKTKRLVSIPLIDKAAQLIQKYATGENEEIFPERDNVSINRDLKTIASLCKIKKKVYHHLGRHTFGTIVANSNVSPFVEKQLMGHASLRTTERYVNNSKEELSQTMASISAFQVKSLKNSSGVRP